MRYCTLAPCTWPLIVFSPWPHPRIRKHTRAGPRQPESSPHTQSAERRPLPLHLHAALPASLPESTQARHCTRPSRRRPPSPPQARSAHPQDRRWRPIGSSRPRSTGPSKRCKRASTTLMRSGKRVRAAPRGSAAHRRHGLCARHVTLTRRRRRRAVAVYSAQNANQKEKFEAELKSQIKKLQRRSGAWETRRAPLARRPAAPL